MTAQIHLPLCLPQTIKATSPLGDPRVTYNLEEGQVPETNMPVRFYIKPNRADGSASILVAENLDYEATSFFTLRVRVQNVASVPLASFTTVYVNVTGECGQTGSWLKRSKEEDAGLQQQTSELLSSCQAGSAPLSLRPAGPACDGDSC